MANIDIEGLLKEHQDDEEGRVPRTKIVCTLGPSSRSVPMLEKLLRAGMNVARFNFSHGTHEYHQETLNNLRIAMQNTNILAAVMLDTKGPEIRTGFLKDGNPIQLKEGRKSPSLLITASRMAPSPSLFYLVIQRLELSDAVVRTLQCLGSDLVNVRKVLGPHAKHIQLMSKVENQEGVINFDEILRETDSFMVARGDLGMEIPVEKIFLAQKMMIYKCNLVGKPVVTATQMLESMIKSPRPTRAEATDVANAVLDGTDCVMLSGESAAGAYPELAVKTMRRICIEAESSLDYAAIFKEMIRSTPLPMSPLESLASSAVRTANKARAKLIVVLTRGGTTAKLVAKYRPAVPILSVVVPVLTTDSFDWTCSDETPARHSLIYRGLIPLLAEGSAKATDAESTEVILGAALKSATEKGLCKPGDAVVALHRIGAASIFNKVKHNSNNLRSHRGALLLGSSATLTRLAADGLLTGSCSVLFYSILLTVMRPPRQGYDGGHCSHLAEASAKAKDAVSTGVAFEAALKSAQRVTLPGNEMRCLDTWHRIKDAWTTK
uniref:pyruvate kinase n=1 Tax=Salix viminalis TaxID=40686 RepID=A0A6N2NC68_SALVM